MNQQAFKFDEFIEEKETSAKEAESVQEEEREAPELDVQKAVVEALASEKAEMDEKLRKSEAEIAEKNSVLSAKNTELEEKSAAIAAKDAEIESLKSALSAANARASELEIRLAAEQTKQFDMQERNPNALALLDRDVELPDRFPGETRDHVLEVIKEARDKAEAEGRVRRAQILESVLVAN